MIPVHLVIVTLKNDIYFHDTNTIVLDVLAFTFSFLFCKYLLYSLKWKIISLNKTFCIWCNSVFNKPPVEKVKCGLWTKDLISSSFLVVWAKRNPIQIYIWICFLSIVTSYNILTFLKKQNIQKCSLSITFSSISKFCLWMETI